MTEVKTIDLTPTWQEAASIIALVLENGTPEGKRQAREELARMAELADAYAGVVAEKTRQAQELVDAAARRRGQRTTNAFEGDK